ncbi:hypothetical protein Hanom_Chr16g01473321 [Helianthus anomalus]
MSYGSNGINFVWIKGVGFLWVPGEIRLLKAFWVVILLKSLCLSPGALTIQVISAFCEWGLGFSVLWEGTNQGGIRMGTAVVFRTLFSALLCFLLFLVLGSSSQPWWSCQWFVNIVLGGICWVLMGDIRCSFAAGVVISLNTLPFRSACLFHSLFGWYFLGNLNRVFVLVASLEGVSTILVTSVVVNGRLGDLMLWGCICPGVIRKEIITVYRTLFSTYNSFWICLEPYSDNQSQSIWSGEVWNDFMIWAVEELFEEGKLEDTKKELRHRKMAGMKSRLVWLCFVIDCIFLDEGPGFWHLLGPLS